MSAATAAARRRRLLAAAETAWLREQVAASA
jgi:hypothetical protein